VSRELLRIVSTPVAQVVILSALTLIMSVVGWYVVLRFRGFAERKDTSSDLLTKFREMRHRGDLSDTEYRTIKTVLAEKLQGELNDIGDKG